MEEKILYQLKRLFSVRRLKWMITFCELLKDKVGADPALSQDTALILLDGLNKTTETLVRIVDVLTEVRTCNFSNTSQKHFRVNQLARERKRL
jgi:hypothetical protein